MNMFSQIPYPEESVAELSNNMSMSYYLFRAMSPATPIVMLSGRKMAAKDWGSWVTQLSASGGLGRPVLIFDNRGAGNTKDKSEVAAYFSRGNVITPKAYTFEDMAKDTILLIEQVFPGKKVHILGMSMGGSIAMECIRLKPELFVSATLSATRCCKLDASMIANVQSSKVYATPPTCNADIELQKTQNLLASNFPSEWLDKNDATYKTICNKYSEIVRNPVGGFAQAAASDAWNGVSWVAEKVTIPTLILHGLQDQMLVPSYAEQTFSLLPNSEMVLLKDAGHMYWHVAGGIACSAVLTFQKTVEQKGAAWTPNKEVRTL